ncbi:protein FAM13A-like [Pungitius pungitius]|uniref:protein FAM13A-like n=1 Tax=Pungitius pungitius TaxID=134920 RepID=UPI00188835EA|nr:protein FAM13A-like [Pungitius pungitius]
MFCFCLKSSLLKLQALEVEGGASLDPSPEEGSPARGSKEKKSPFGPPELRGNEGKTPALCHGVISDENNLPERLTVLTRRPPLTFMHPGEQPLIPDGAVPPSYEGEVGGEGGSGALLQLLSGGPSPLPSPRCLTPSQRFNSDPETAPSPPCSQQYMRCQARDWSEVSEEPSCPSSISFLTRQIQTLKKKVRRFEDQFEQEMNYKPSHIDKYSNPEMIRVMGDLATARRRLKEMRLRQSVFECKEPEAPENSCRSGQEVEHPPSLEDTVEVLFRRLREKRQALGLPDNMKDMTQAQMVLEKITLQKCLLYFESLHGRPAAMQKNLVKPLYDRYQMIKRLLCSSPTIGTIEEEDGSDDDSMSLAVHELPDPPPCTTGLTDGDPAFVSPLDEVKAIHQQTFVATANLHEASRSQLLKYIRETRAEKKLKRKALREFEDMHHRQTGRMCQKEDRSPMKEEYHDYKQLKAKLRLLEVFLSKQEVTKIM